MEHHGHAKDRHGHPYRLLAIMALLSFGAMYVLMYGMVNALPNVFNSLNQAYMAGLMASPMVLIELLLMRSMYPNRRANVAIIAGSVLAGLGFWFLIRGQVGIGDGQFLRSMIPHHAGAILMCDEASLQDPEIKELCRAIQSGQQREVDWMKTKLAELEGQRSRSAGALTRSGNVVRQQDGG